MSTPIITGGDILPGTALSMGNNLIDVSLGNKVLVDAGMVNTVVLGSFSRLVVGVSTIINIGAKMDVALANTITLLEGDSWLFSPGNNTTYDYASKWGIYYNLLAGGTTIEEKNRRWDEEKQSRIIRLAALTSYVLILGLSLVEVQFPAITDIGVINDDGEWYINSADANDFTASGVTTDPNDNIVSNVSGLMSAGLILAEAFTIIAVMTGQWMLAKKMADNLKDCTAVANILLSSQGITSAVFSNPNQQPKLFPANHPMNNSGEDKYIKSMRGTPAAIFNMLPGMPTDEALEDRARRYTNWKNWRKGYYPTHDNTPVVTLGAQLESLKNKSSTIDIMPDSILITSNAGDRQQGMPLAPTRPPDFDTNSASRLGYEQALEVYQEACANFEHDPSTPRATASIVLDSYKHGQIQTNRNGNPSTIGPMDGSSVMIEATDSTKRGGYFYMSEHVTSLLRHGDYIELSVVGQNPQAVENNTNNNSLPLVSSGGGASESASSSQESISESSSPSPTSPSQNNSGLYLGEGAACLTTNDGLNGIFIENGNVIIRVNGQDKAWFNDNNFVLDQEVEISKKGILLEDLYIKRAPKTEAMIGRRTARAVHMREILDKSIDNIRQRILEMENHKVNTGGFSGTLLDDHKNDANWDPFDGYYSDGGWKVGLFGAGWRGFLGSLNPFPRDWFRRSNQNTTPTTREQWGSGSRR